MPERVPCLGLCAVQFLELLHHLRYGAGTEEQDHSKSSNSTVVQRRKLPACQNLKKLVLKDKKPLKDSLISTVL